MTTAGLAGRALSLLRAGYGALLLCMPGTLIGAITGHPASRHSRTVARVLGARHLTQAALTAVAPSPAVLSAGALVDVAHAASMLALAARERPLRQAELADALAAALFAAASAAATPGTGGSAGTERPAWPPQG